LFLKCSNALATAKIIHYPILRNIKPFFPAIQGEKNSDKMEEVFEKRIILSQPYRIVNGK